MQVAQEEEVDSDNLHAGVRFRVAGGAEMVRQNVEQILGQSVDTPGLKHGPYQFARSRTGATIVCVSGSGFGARRHAKKLVNSLHRLGVPAELDRAVSWNTFVMLLVSTAIITLVSLQLLL